MNCKTVMITGTKGKTTVSFLIDNILMALKKETLRVDTTGHFLNGERRSTLEESKELWGLVPTVCPGRYLWELKSFDGKRKQNTVAVLEAALGCSNLPGTGIKLHDIGVWTNVMADHLGSTSRLRKREDIADAKDFIFKRIRDGGYAIFNACDKLVCSKTDLISESCTILPCVIDGDPIYYDLENHFQNGGTAFILRGTKIFQKTASEEKLVYDAEHLPWTFEGHFKPSMINLMLALAAVYGVYDGEFPAGLKEAVDGIRMDPYGGRLTVLRAKNGATVIADYAHEKESLAMVGELAKSLANKKGGKTIGVVRLAYDRTDELIHETGRVIGQSYDELVVYDKIDGYWRKPKKLDDSRFVQEVGRISSLLSEAIKETNEHVTTILREDEAIAFAAKEAAENDVVVVIVNDDVHRSVDWIREKFEAEFV